MKNRTNVTWEHKILSTKDLSIDEAYQRDVDKVKIDRIVRKYDPCLVNAVKCSFRDGKYYIFDGQHTSVVEKAVRGGGKDVPVDCKVFYGLTRLDEMELFVAQNGDSTPVNITQKLRAMYNFGDSDVVGMVKAAQAAGVRVDFKKGPAMNRVVALSTLFKIYLRLPIDQYIDLLTTLRIAWGGIPESFGREILIGMEKFYTEYWGRFKSNELAKSLSKISPAQIPREGKAMGASTLTASVYARIILRVYNRNRRIRLEDRL